MSTPVIGVCAVYERARWSFWDQPAALVADTYLAKVRDAGGLPICLAPDQRAVDQPELLLSRIDGLLLVGGADLDPPSYGAERFPECEATFPERDAFEIALTGAALLADLPILGICRGIQIMNVATGGTLHQHLPGTPAIDHRPAPGHLDGKTTHEIDVLPGTLAAGLAGAGLQIVNSHHHQGVCEIGKGAVVTARSVPDHLPEALEFPQRRYALGVQWHPEAPYLAHAFHEFVTAAASHSADRNSEDRNSEDRI